MGALLETRINTVEHIQEEFGHDIQEIKGQLARLTKLIKGHTRIMLKNIRGSPSFPLQPPFSPFIHQRHPSHESRIPVRGNVPLKVHHPNWQSHAPTTAIIQTCWSNKSYREQSRKVKKKSRQETIGSYFSYIHRITSQITSGATYCAIMCASS